MHRPIKKVREAKDRKKFKAAQRLEKLRKKSALLADEEGMTEKDKAQSIAKLMNKGSKEEAKAAGKSRRCSRWEQRNFWKTSRSQGQI